MRSALRIPLAAAALAVCAATAFATPLLMGSIQPESSYIGRWIRLVYTEAFRRVGVPFDIAVYPTQRLTLLSDGGEVDGDVARVHGYAAAHPQLVRVEEPVMDARMVLYGLAPQAGFPDLPALARTELKAVVTRGVAVCESTLRNALGPERVVAASTGDQALRMLLAQRVDLMCSSDIAMQHQLLEPEFRGAANVRAVLDLGPFPFYPYLHRRHAALAPQLATALKQMKTEGLIERYRQEALSGADKP
ncbi:substrate-binding periplasmic protein [Ideonella sp. BN130291]|uniref:substrate-binding periplasmic protein n=1 Tax=Ideonella sp. BN130291 TaxID=3112940 RepID=UPI002E2710C5|nr:hypothetical protein [Ideonella sp. BN130291]